MPFTDSYANKILNLYIGAKVLNSNISKGDKMKILLYLLIIFNMIDAYCTIYLTELGWYELNPISRFFLQWPIIFIWLKLIIPSFFSMLAWRLRKYTFTHILIWICFIPYAIIAIRYILLFTFVL
jgi:hypothetical protein